MGPARMKTVSEQQARQVAAVEGSATLLHVPFVVLAHLKVALPVRSAEGLSAWQGQPLPLHQTQQSEARISPHYGVPASVLAPLPRVVPEPVHDNRGYCRHRMESAFPQAQETLYSTSSGSFG